MATLQETGSTAKVAGPAAWATVTVLERSPALKVTVAEREERVGLAVAVRRRVAFPVPELWLRSNQGWLLEAVQAVLLLTATLLEFSVPRADQEVGDKTRVASPAAWVTATVRTCVPAVKVAIAVRIAVVALALTESITERLPVPELLDKVSQGWSLDTVQAALLVTATDFVPAALVAAQVDTASAKVGTAASWTTVTVFTALPALKVTVAVRSSAVVLTAAVIPTVPLPVPEVLESASQDWLLAADQVALLLTATTWDPPERDGFQEAGSMARVGSPAAWVTATVLIKVPALKVTVAVREETVGLAAAASETTSLPAPEATSGVSQAWLLATVHKVLLTTCTDVELADLGAAQEIGVTASAGIPVAASCVTVTATSGAPAAEKVTVVVRTLTIGLAATLKVSEVLPLPPAADSVTQS